MAPRALVRAATDLYRAVFEYRGAVPIAPDATNLLVRCCILFLSRLHHVIEMLRTEVYKKEVAQEFYVGIAVMMVLPNELTMGQQPWFPTIFSVDFPSHVPDSVTDTRLRFSTHWPDVRDSFRQLFSTLEPGGIRDVFANAFSIVSYLEDVLTKRARTARLPAISKTTVQEMLQEDEFIRYFFMPMFDVSRYKTEADAALAMRKKPADIKYLNNVFDFSNASSNYNYS